MNRRIKAEKRQFLPYNSIDFCPVWNFYKVIETNDLRYILRLQNYEQLPEIHFDISFAWDLILKQYFKESFGVKHSKWLQLRRTIATIKDKIIFIKSSITLLSYKKNLSVIEVIRGLGIKFDDSTEDAYYDSILALQSQLMGFQKLLQIKNKEFYYEFTSDGKQVSIYKIIHRLEQFKGFSLDSHTLSVRQFLIYQTEFAESIIHTKVLNNRTKQRHNV